MIAEKNTAAQSNAGPQSGAVVAPSISLPKGGGAIRGMGEKFAANPVTGTGSMSVPIATSPGRSGFGPQLSLSYDSGAGNGPFGIGWHLSLPAITRKTDKGLPRYFDAEDSDIFILSGAEDLVPVLVSQGGNWGPEQLPDCNVNGARFRIDRYRPRVEGLFACIERWSNLDDPTDIRWRSISKDNVTTWYGSDATSRISDPSDQSHIFSWLIRQSHDDKGNTIVYEYVRDDSQQVDLAQAHESNRTDPARKTNCYLRRVRYGNRTPYFPNYDPAKPSTPLPADQDWMFSVVFDYDEGRYQPVSAPGAEPSLVHATFDPPALPTGWPVRLDPFSSYRSGFEVRTYRLCRRVLMFHHIPDVPADLAHNVAASKGYDGLVRSTELNYQEDPVGSFIASVVQSSYVRLADDDPRQKGDIYQKRSLPPLEFEYTEAKISSEIHGVDPASIENLPVGLDGSAYQWVDLDGEGLTGILSEQGDAWYYKRNLSALPQLVADGSLETRACFAPLECVARLPGSAAGGRHQFLDLAGDGSIDVVDFSGPTPGFYERTDDGSWAPFTSFRSLPNVAWDDPNQRFIDLTGDGHADILITEDNVFTFYASLAEDGFDQAENVYQSFDEKISPRLLVADACVLISTADMSGDGLADIVRIRNGEVCYWPNLGYGNFGPKVTLDNSPWFDSPDQFDPRRFRLADIDGSGTTDLIYLGRNRLDIYRNLSGNRLSDAEPLDDFPPVDSHTAVQACDLLGNGTACLVWSSPLSGDTQRPMQYVDLMGGQKPHLLTTVRNNLGAETTIQYAPSTKFYLADKLAGRPWITKLPFPVHVVEKVTVTDIWRKTTFSSTYSYHHGYFDGIEREFRGFGRVEQVDCEAYRTFADAHLDSSHVTKDQTLYQPPVKIITWYHTGAALERQRVINQFETEYFPQQFANRLPDPSADPAAFFENPLPEPEMPAGLDADEWREALRACKGMVLRQEVYELDVDKLSANPSVQMPVRLFSTAFHNCNIQLIQPRGGNHYACFLVTESEALTYHYELDLSGNATLRPDPRIAHTLNLRHDEYGNAQQSVTVGYPRWQPGDMSGLPSPDSIHAAQAEEHVAYAETHHTADCVLRANQISLADTVDPATPIRYYRLRLPCEVRTYELKGIAKSGPRYYELNDFRQHDLSDRYGHEPGATPPPKAVQLKQYHEYADGTVPQERIVEHTRTLFFKDEDGITQPTDPHDFGYHGPRGLKYEDYKLALTDALLDAVFQQRDPNTGAVLDDKLTWEFETGISVRNKLDEPKATGSHYLKSGYILGEGIDPSLTGQYWMRSGIAGFATNADRHFYLPERYTDPFDNVTTLQYDPLDLYLQLSQDALGNTTAVSQFDYRVLSPSEMKDLNGNYSAVAFDIFGLPVASAVMGKNRTESGDNLTGLQLDLPVADVQKFLNDAYDSSTPTGWLVNATSRFVYDFGFDVVAGEAITYCSRPASACGIARETHVKAGGAIKIQVGIEYSDGMGTVLVKKSQAEPDPDSTLLKPPLRWIASGKTILNNKGKPVKQYEPYFSPIEIEHRFDTAEVESEIGVTPIMYYDAPGRLIRTEMPDGTLSRVEFSPWLVRGFDANDTVLESTWYQTRNQLNPANALTRDINGTISAPPEQRAGWLAARDANTPAQTHIDSLGREAIAIVNNRVENATGQYTYDNRKWADEYYLTFSKLDAEGKPLWIRDARGNLVMQYITPPKATRWADESNEAIPSYPDPVTKNPIYSAPCYDIAGNLLSQHSMDAGDRWTINDAAGKPMFAWDFNEREDGTSRFDEKRLYYTEYDALHRPTGLWLRIWDRPTPTPPAPAETYTGHAWEKVERFEYQDGLTSDVANLNGQLIRHYDPSGLTETVRRDYQGNVQQTRRTLVADGTVSRVDWQSDANPDGTSKLSTETFTQITEYDALNRMTLHYNWHRDPASVAAYIPLYNERGALVSEKLLVRANRTPAGPTGGVNAGKPDAIQEIRYNVKGQKEYLKLGNGTLTQYDYDPTTFRLKQIRTTRPADATDFPARRSNLTNAHIVQQLLYTYDPVGNLTEVEDQAFEPVFFDQGVVEPKSQYEYDALYRLTWASGRETAKGGDVALTGDDPDSGHGFPVTDQTLRRYIQRYTYDQVGNFLLMAHSVPTDSTSGWTRQYQPAIDSNRLLRTWSGTKDWDNTPPDKRIEYVYDTHGSMRNLVRTAAQYHLRWDHRDMIGGIDLGGGGQAYYQYDVGKHRSRKVIGRNPPDAASHTIKEERIYLGGYELYRRYTGDPNDPVEEIESHDLFEGEQRVLLVDDVLHTRMPRPDALTVKVQTLFRYYYSNHLGSACLELDDHAEIISYEEYHPYGTTAYQAINSTIQAPPKRYRYTGMEKDEEIGVNYHGARYYAPWLGRWLACDPGGTRIADNVYVYAAANPAVLVDRTGHAPKLSAEHIAWLGDVSELFGEHGLERSTLEAVAFEAQGGPLYNEWKAETTIHLENLQTKLQRAQNLLEALDELEARGGLGQDALEVLERARANLLYRATLGQRVEALAGELGSDPALSQRFADIPPSPTLERAPGSFVSERLQGLVTQRGLDPGLGQLIPEANLPAEFAGITQDIRWVDAAAPAPTLSSQALTVVLALPGILNDVEQQNISRRVAAWKNPSFTDAYGEFVVVPLREKDLIEWLFGTFVGDLSNVWYAKLYVSGSQKDKSYVLESDQADMYLEFIERDTGHFEKSGTVFVPGKYSESHFLNPDYDVGPRLY